MYNKIFIFKMILRKQLLVFLYHFYCIKRIYYYINKNYILFCIQWKKIQYCIFKKKVRVRIKKFSKINSKIIIFKINLRCGDHTATGEGKSKCCNEND
jgi:hypothetical protein